MVDKVVSQITERKSTICQQDKQNVVIKDELLYSFSTLYFDPWSSFAVSQFKMILIYHKIRNCSPSDHPPNKQLQVASL